MPGYLRRSIAIGLCWSLFASPAVRAADEAFTVVRVDTATQELQAFWADEQGRPFKQFDRLAAWLGGKGKKLVFAMNAGMFHADLSPVGLLVADGKEIAPLNTSAGGGNFFLKPNGVFLLAADGPKVVETSEYPGTRSGIRIATQSGPLLLRRGVIHPAFNPASTSRLIRNGVGVSGRVAIFVMANRPVSFHEMAVYFRDVLHCQDALYLDGVVSRLYADELSRADLGTDLGPMVGVTVGVTADRPISGRAPPAGAGDAD